MSDELKVRVATEDDVHEVMQIALAACAENGFVNPDPQRLLGEIWPALQRDNGLVAVIGEEGGRLEGAVLLRIGTMWYSNDRVLEEKAIFIHPDYRAAAGGRARKLCEFSKKASDLLNLPLVIGVLSNHRTEGKVRMYQRVFGPSAGAFFLYNAKTGNHATPEPVMINETEH